LCHELYLSALDVELHSSDDFWRSIVTSLWPKYKAPLELDKQDAHACSFVPIFSGPFGAGYYSGLWSSMLAADIFQTFGEQRKSDKDHVVVTEEELGGRFRSTFLSLGGGHHPAEIFRRFRGRDPTPSALLRNLGLVEGDEEIGEIPKEVEIRHSIQMQRRE
jgi:oligopeptidase A